jgi:hypothetical protein
LEKGAFVVLKLKVAPPPCVITTCDRAAAVQLGRDKEEMRRDEDSVVVAVKRGNLLFKV